MQFSNLHNGSRADRKTARLALVAGLHVALGMLFVHGINTKTLSLSNLPDPVVRLIQPDPVEPLPPPEPPKPLPQLAPPDVVVPKIEVDVAPPPQPSPVQATTESDPTPFPPMASQPTVPEAPPTPTADRNAGQMRSAVLADAKACALPDYPAKAARNGESGTTTLALLVGVDGRVSSARVEHSSGSRDLDRAAVNALSLCRFQPATENGVAQAAWAQLAYVWTLE